MLLAICFVLFSFVTVSSSSTSSSVHLYVSAYFFQTLSEDLDIFSSDKLQASTVYRCSSCEEIIAIMRMLISGFSPAKQLGTRANQKISGYNRIRVDGWKRFEYAACGRKNFRIHTKNISGKKISVYVWTAVNIMWYCRLKMAISL